MAMYKYNGIEAPKLPVVKDHPYVVLSYHEQTVVPGTYYGVVVFSSKPMYRSKSDVYVTRTYTDGSFIRYDLVSDMALMEHASMMGYCENITAANEWTLNLQRDEPEEGSRWDVLGSVEWTNTDILNEDGTLYLAASEPVPVNPVSTPAIHPTSLLLGWMTGQKIAGLRNKKE